MSILCLEIEALHNTTVEEPQGGSGLLSEGCKYDSYLLQSELTLVETGNDTCRVFRLFTEY
jgi:hypothetical protein